MLDDIEDMSLYFEGDFAVTGTLAGQPVSGILGTETVESVDGVLTQELTYRLQAQSASQGQALVVDGTTYSVRRVESMPPDGATLRLVLARV